MADRAWQDAERAALDVASYMNRYAIVAEHERGMTKDQLAELMRTMEARQAKEMAADLVHYRRQLYATASTRGAVQ